MKNYKHLETICIDQMSIDYMPLHDIVREFTKNNAPPSDEEFTNALKFLNAFLSKNKVKRLTGPDMESISLGESEFIELLKRESKDLGYPQINYKYWFEFPR